MLELELDRVSRHYGTKIAVDGIEMSIEHGVYGLLGANGAGKTTLMRMLCGLLPPTSGEIRLNGEEIGRLGSEYRRLLGYLPQDLGYYPEFTAERYLKYLARLKAISPQFIPQKLMEVLELTGLRDARKQRLKTFSGGMLRRLGIAQALLNDPVILILDEPTAGLDPKERIRFRNIISAMGKNRIVLLSTHIVQDVEFIADHILLMKGGRIMESGSPQEVTQAVRGMVWECLVAEAQAEELSSRYPVSNLKYSNGQIQMRIISKNIPVADAVKADPNLEDVYLAYFALETGAKAQQ